MLERVRCWEGEVEEEGNDDNVDSELEEIWEEACDVSQPIEDNFHCDADLIYPVIEINSRLLGCDQATS
jgi:hypothetical protein